MMNGSSVMAKIAGIESRANTMSVISMNNSVMNSGVASRLPFSIVNSFCPSNSWVVGKRFVKNLRIGLSSGWMSSVSLDDPEGGEDQERTEDVDDPFEVARSERRRRR